MLDLSLPGKIFTAFLATFRRQKRRKKILMPFFDGEPSKKGNKEILLTFVQRETDGR